MTFAEFAARKAYFDELLARRRLTAEEANDYRAIMQREALIVAQIRIGLAAVVIDAEAQARREFEVEAAAWQRAHRAAA